MTLAIRLIFMGPPGSGKGTQAQRLNQRLNLTQLSSGHVLRTEIKEGSPIGKQAAEYVESGGLVPDEIITGVMLAAMDKLPVDSGFILDGFPRTVPQAETLEQGMAERGWSVDAVLDFEMPDDVIVQRISKRLVCTNCGATYNAEFLPPRVVGICDLCGGTVSQRKDDQPEVVRHRLHTYREQTEPLVAYYKQRDLLHVIDSFHSAGEVERMVLGVVQQLSGS